MTPVSYQENRSRDITKPNSVLQIKILSQRISIKVSWQKSVFEKSKVWRRKKHLRWQPAGSLRPYESKSCGKKVCLKKKKTKSGEEKTSKMTACWEPEASCSLCNQNLEGHPEDYTMIFPPPARWGKGGKNGLSSFFIQSWGWTLISPVVPHDLKNRARVMILG